MNKRSFLVGAGASSIVMGITYIIYKREKSKFNEKKIAVIEQALLEHDEFLRGVKQIFSDMEKNYIDNEFKRIASEYDIP